MLFFTELLHMYYHKIFDKFFNKILNYKFYGRVLHNMLGSCLPLFKINRFLTYF